MVESKKMPKGWDNLSPLAKASYVDADFVERVDDAMSEASKEILERDEELVKLEPKARRKKLMEIMRKYVDPVWNKEDIQCLK